MRILLFTLLLLTFSIGYGQENSIGIRKAKSIYLEMDSTKKAKLTSVVISNAKDSGKIEIEEPTEIGVLIQKYNEAKKDQGYRIQLFSGQVRNEATKAQLAFLNIYPSVSTYLIYQAPNFKIRVGDFENRLQANKFFEEMKATFPGSFIIGDEIKFESNL